MTSPGDPETRSRPRLAVPAWWAFGLLAVVGLAVTVWWSLTREPPLPAGLSRQEYDRAAERFLATYRREPERSGVLLLLGETAVAEQRPAAALRCFQAIPTDDRTYGRSARFQEAQVLLRLNRAIDAERRFREFLTHGETDAAVPRSHLLKARKWLDYILSVELRFEDRKPMLAAMHAAGQADVYDSKQYCFPTLLIWHSTKGRDRLEEFLDQDPDSPVLQIAHARYLTTDGRLDQAQTLLEELHHRRPDDAAATAALLECHFEAADRDRFAEVASRLPAYRDDEPWLLTRMRGEFALDEKRWNDAAAHFRNVLERNPSDPACHMGLASALAGLGDDAARRDVLQRSRVLSEIRVDLVGVTEEDAQASRRLAEACEQIGLHEAAGIFRQHAERIARPERRPGRMETVPL